MALIINLEQEQEDFLMEVLSHFSFIHSIKKTQKNDASSLSNEEKNILDERWAKYEKEGVEGITLDELNAKIKAKYGI